MVDGTALKDSEFWDEDSKKFVTVTLSVRDIIYFRLLERLIGVTSNNG